MCLILKTNKGKIFLLIALILILTLLLIQSVLLGYIKTSFEDFINTYKNYSNITEHIIIKSSRVPRTIIALFVGASLSVSGVLMQTLTKNPMASPGLMGINSGSAFFMVLTYSLLPSISQNYVILFSFLGAAISVILVYILAGGIRGSIQTFDLTLAGAAVSAFFISLMQIFLYKDQKTMEEILYWLTGSVEGKSLDSLIKIAPLLLTALLISFLLSNKLNILSLGEDTAKGLGLNTEVLKIQIIILVVILAGGSVSVAGPIGLIGLIIPHITRSLVGSEFKWVIPYSMVLGAILLLSADIISRFIIYPKEIPVGAITAILGTPFFIYLARKAENN